jgi:hypothetical protein
MVKSSITLFHSDEHKYCGNLPKYFNPRKSRVKITAVIVFYNICPGRGKIHPDLMAKCLSKVNATMSKTEAHIETWTNGVDSLPTTARNPEKTNI